MVHFTLTIAVWPFSRWSDSFCRLWSGAKVTSGQCQCAVPLCSSPINRNTWSNYWPVASCRVPRWAIKCGPHNGHLPQTLLFGGSATRLWTLANWTYWPLLSYEHGREMIIAPGFMTHTNVTHLCHEVAIDGRVLVFDECQHWHEPAFGSNKMTASFTELLPILRSSV